MPAWESSETGEMKASYRRRTGAGCQVPGCMEDLSGLKLFFTRNRICKKHCQQESMVVNGTAHRFCQQCGRFHTLAEFDGNKRTCRSKLEKHNARRRISRMKRAASLNKSQDTPTLLSKGKAPLPSNDSPTMYDVDQSAAIAVGKDYGQHSNGSFIASQSLPQSPVAAEPRDGLVSFSPCPSDTDEESDQLVDCHAELPPPSHHSAAVRKPVLQYSLDCAAANEQSALLSALYPATACASYPSNGQLPSRIAPGLYPFTNNEAAGLQGSTTMASQPGSTSSLSRDSTSKSAKPRSQSPSYNHHTSAQHVSAPCSPNSTSAIISEMLHDYSFLYEDDDVLSEPSGTLDVSMQAAAAEQHPTAPNAPLSTKHHSHQQLYRELLHCTTTSQSYPKPSTSHFQGTPTTSTESDQAVLSNSQHQASRRHASPLCTPQCRSDAMATAFTLGMRAAQQDRCDPGHHHSSSLSYSSTCPKRFRAATHEGHSAPSPQKSSPQESWSRTLMLPCQSSGSSSPYPRAAHVMERDDIHGILDVHGLGAKRGNDMLTDHLLISAVDDCYDPSEYDCGTEIWINIPSRVVDLTLKAMQG